MNTPVENLANEIRSRLYSNEFRCLSSFLSAVAELSGALGAGVASIVNGDVIHHRSVGLDWNDIKIHIRDELIRGNEQDKKKVQVDSLGEWTVDNRYLLLRRFWPPGAWPQRPGERFWLYVFDPKYIVEPTFCASPHATEQFGSLISSFVRWKNERIARHDEFFVEARDKDEAVMEIEKLVVRPVLPSQFHKMLQKLSATDYENDVDATTSKKWDALIDRLLKACVQPSKCRCPKSESEKLAFYCPQSEPIDDVLRTLAMLEKWNTKFWMRIEKYRRPNDEISARTREDIDSLIFEAISGLKEAAKHLLSVPKFEAEPSLKPLDFNSGAVGLSGERLLVRYFCGRAILMSLELYESNWLSLNCTTSELEFPARLARLASTLIGDGRWTPDAIENLLQVVAMFGHEVFDVPRRIDLVRHLRQTLRGETALHTLKARYRDHFFHTLEVCFLGFSLLSTEVSSGVTLASHIVGLRSGQANDDPSSHIPTDEKTLFGQWWCAALVHDTAYGIDIFDGTLKLLEYFSGNPLVKDFADNARKAASQIAQQDRLKELAVELEKDPTLRKGDHGVIAAMGLNSILSRIGGKTQQKYQASVRAIAFHNTRFPQVNAGKDPIAALLILCDTVQEWGRSSLGFNHSPSVLLSRMMEASLTPPEEQFGPVKRYKLSIETDPSNPGRLISVEEKTLKIGLEYGDASLLGCNAKFTWADFTYNLQRVDFRPWGLNLRVTISVPIGESKTSQFDHFGDFIREQEVRFIERWHKTAFSRDPARAVCHLVDDLSEIITFNLNELSREYREETPMMGGTIGDFSKAIERWHVFARQQHDSTPNHTSPV